MLLKTLVRKHRVWAVILLGVIVYAVMSIYADWEDLVSAMKDFDLRIIPAILALTTANLLLRFIRWNFFLHRAGVRLGLKHNLFVYFSGLIMTVTPGKSGEMWMGWLIKDIYGEELSKTIPVVLITRATDVFALVILSFLGLLYYQQSVYLVFPLLAIIIIFFAFIRSKKISQKMILILENRAGKYTESVRTMHRTFEATMEPKGLAAMTVFAALSWFMECLGFYLVVLGFDESISLTLSAFIFSFASLAGGISMLPGGLGVVEAGISGMLELFDYTSAVAVGTAIIVRFGTLWYSVLLGTLVYFTFRGRVKLKPNINTGLSQDN